MPTALQFTAFGAAALKALQRAIDEAKIDDPLAPVTVVASNVRSAVGLRRALGAGDEDRAGVANVHFVVLADLARRFGADEFERAGRVPLTRHALVATIRAVLGAEGGIFTPIADHHASEEALASAYETLRFSRREAVAALASSGRRQAEITRVLGVVRSRVEQATYDDADLFTSTIATPETSGDFADLGTVIVYLPDELGSLEIGLVARIARARPVEIFLGMTGDAESDEPTLAFARALLESLQIERPPLRDDGNVATADEPLSLRGGDELIAAADPSIEVREALRVVLGHLRVDARPSRVAILYAKRDPYLRLVASIGEDAGIPLALPSPERLSTKPDGMRLLALTSLFDATVSRRAVIDLAAASFVGRDRSRIGEWDRCSRLSGFREGSLEMFIGRIDELLARSQRVSAESDSSGEGRLSPRLRRAKRTAKACRELSEFIAEIDTAARRGAGARSWAEFVGWAREVVSSSRIARADQSESALRDDETLDDLLGSFEVLDHLGVAASPEAFRRMLAIGLDQAASARGRAANGVFVGALGAAASLSFDLVVVLGCSDRAVVSRSIDAVFSLSDRSVLALPASSATADRLRARRTLATALLVGERRVLFYPVAEGARPNVAFRPIDHWPVSIARSGRSGLAAVHAAPSSALSCSELSASALFFAASAGEDLSLHHLVVGDEAFASRLSARRSVDALAFDEYSGAVLRPIGSGLDDVVLSPTTLEEYAHCPFRFFLTHVLFAESIEDPESRLVVDPRDRGLLVHEILERYVSALMSETSEFERDDAADAQLLAGIANEVFDRFERLAATGPRAIWAVERRRLLRLLESERRRDAAKRLAERFTTRAVELRFGDGVQPPVEIAVEGRNLRFRGVIDRLDESVDGSLVVTDYKTGRSEPFRALRSDPVDRGRHLQLPIYALAARAACGWSGGIRASYRFLDRDGEEISVELDDRLRRRFADATSTLVAGIDAGMFIYHPGTPDRDTFSNCAWCDFKTICPPDRARIYEHNRSSSRVGAYGALADEPWSDLELAFEESAK